MRRERKEMRPYLAFFYWMVAIFIWIYLLPILFVGTFLCIPFFVLVTPPLMIISLTVMYLFKDEIIPEGSIRKLVNHLPYHQWFGRICDVPDISNTRKLICSHPHGIICTSVLFSIHFRPKSTTVFAVSKWLFTVPFVGWLARHVGCIPATYKDIEAALQKTSVILVPGGVPELVTGKLYTKRYGFLKIAHKIKVPIMPCTSSTKYYHILACPFESMRLYIAEKIDLPLMFPAFGWYGTWLPNRSSIQMNVFEDFIPTGDFTKDNENYFLNISRNM